MVELTTQRFRISFEETAKGGPGGYESVYLTSEGSPAEESLYHLLERFDGTLLPAQSKALRQRNGAALVDAISQGKKIGIASGFKPSGAYHFGHNLTSGALAFFQRNGAQIFVPVADVECSLGRIPKETYLSWASDNLVDWGANGVNLDAAHVYLQSEEFRVSSLAYLVARGLTFELAADTYGLDKLVKDFPFLFAGMTQVADILLPQHYDFGNSHSFMLSGQDQDGHMQMTIALTQRSVEDRIDLLGVQTVPSGLYIPHIRGLDGSKASSSRPNDTLYLGPGPGNEDIENRIRTSLGKFDKAYANAEIRQFLERCALDMVRYIDGFNAESKVDFAEIAAQPEYKALVAAVDSSRSTAESEKAQMVLDDYLVGNCRAQGQDNITIVRDLLANQLVAHQKRREEVINYALSRAAGNGDAYGIYSSGNAAPRFPSFWQRHQRDIDPALQTITQWYDLVAASKDKLQP